VNTSWRVHEKTGLNFKVEYCLFLDFILWGAEELPLFLFSSSQNTHLHT